MSLWKRIEQALWTGKILKEYGPLSEGRYGAAERTVSALLANRQNSDCFVIRVSTRGF